jgi:hypothetical protein
MEPHAFTHLSPARQEALLRSLLDQLGADDASALLTVAEWMASDMPRGQQVSKATILKWISDVKMKNQAHPVHRPASMLRIVK